MHRDARAYLWDVRQAADEIVEFISGLDGLGYAQSNIVHSAVERKFEIIGEALNQLSKLDPALADKVPNVRDIVGFRNILIHGYAAINHDHVWRIVKTALPDLRAAAATLLDELGPP